MSTVTGTRALVRLVVRRDRVVLAVWALLAVGIPLANTFSMAALLPTPHARQQFVTESMDNPVVHAMLGPIFSPSIEGIVAWRSNVQCVLVAGLASLLLVIRHTRAEEEAGRREVLGSAPVGRHAGLTAVLGVVLAVNLVSALALGTVLVVGRGYPAAGSFVFTLSIAAAGWVFAAVAATAAQLAGAAAQARSYAIGTFAVSFAPVVFAAGGGAAWLTWLSPVSWTRAAQPYAGDRWPVLLIPIAVATVVTWAAYAMSARRDLGAGMLPDRGRGAGPSRAAPGLRSPLALAWRLHKDPLVSWGAGLSMASIALGFAAVSFDELFTDLAIIEDWLATMGRDTIGEAFLAIITFDIRLIVACVAVATALRLRTEETRGHVDPLLAGPTSRSRWMGSHMLVAFAGPSAILAAVGLSAGLVYGVSTGRPGALVDQLATAMRFLPAVWLMAAVAVAVFGLLPRAAVAVSWGFVGLCVVFVFLWEVRAIGEHLFVFTPFAYNHPAVAPAAVVPIAVAVLATALAAIGALAFRRRDVGA